jgi:CRISPR-associated protein Csb2
MALAVTVELITGSYEAADSQDRELAEWPPHPARLYCALVASARTEQERAALHWLEQQGPPVVHAAGQARSFTRSGYVVTNEVTARKGSQTHPGRTNGLRTRTHTLPGQTTIRFVWEGASAAPDVVRSLDDLARRVPYLGRSSGIALVGAAVVDPDRGVEAGRDSDGTGSPEASPSPGWDVFEPCDVLDADDALRVPYSGYLDELDEQYAASRPAWEVSRSHGYRRRRPPDEKAIPECPSAYTDLVAFRFAGWRPDGRLAARFTEALRSHVLRTVGSAAPEALHGHDADGRPHVAFLALPDVGGEEARSRYADGHLLGLAVAVPELPAEQRRAVLRGVLGLRRADDSGTVSLDVPGIGMIELDYQPGLYRPWGASPRRWRQGSRRWISATPVVLDRYPKKPGQDVDEVLRSCRMLGLPEPVDIQVSSEPLMAGAVRMRPRDLPKRAKGRLFRHVALTFDRIVAGPVLLGAGRYLGIGLMAPVDEGKSA